MIPKERERQDGIDHAPLWLVGKSGGGRAPPHAIYNQRTLEGERAVCGRERKLRVDCAIGAYDNHPGTLAV